MFIAQRTGEVGGYLYVKNGEGEVITLAEFERFGDAETAAKLFNVHVNEKPVY